MMRGKEFPESEKQKIVNSLLSAVSDEDTVKRFHRGVKAPDDGRNMYPKFYITPYNNGKKLRLITGELPKTHILASNHYELEILRILALFDKDNPKVKYMIDETIKRLDKTCYAHWCSTGECIGAGISVLRFLSAVRPQKEQWINQILAPLIRLHDAGKGGAYLIKVNIPFYYMLTAVSVTANELCREFIDSQKESLTQKIGLTEITKSSFAIPTNITNEYGIEKWCAIKNALSILPEFEYLKSVR